MKAILAGIIISLVIFGGVASAPAADPKDNVRVEILNTDLHQGMDPGLYVCAGSHLHIKGTVQNVTKKTLVSIKLEGKAYDAKGKLVGTAYPRKLKPLRLVPLKPREKAEFDLEFRTLTGAKIQMAEKQEIVVIEAAH